MVRLASSSLALLVLLAAPSPAATQIDPFGPRPVHVLEVTTRSRWLHEAQAPAAVAYVDETDRFRIRYRPPSDAGANRGYTLDTGRRQGRLSMDRRNVVWSLSVVPPARRYELDRGPEVDGVRSADEERGRGRGWLGLPGTRLWELPFPLPGGEITPGLTWTDTVRIDSESGRWSRERLQIAWSLEAVGDTLVDGRRLPIVRVGGDVDVGSTHPVGDAARAEPFRVESTGRGHLRGRVVVDTTVGLRAAGADTLVVEGTSTLVFQDGRRFTEPARFERIRAFALRDSSAWEAEEERRRAERRRTRGGMLRVPEASEGGGGLDVDSLWSAWASTDDPDERGAAETALRSATGMPWRAFETELRRRRLALGDSASVMQGLAEGGGVGAPLSLERWREVAPFLHDPGRLWRWGIAPRWTYSGMIEAVRTADAGDSGAGCVPAACDAILAAMASSPEPRLREAAAVARFHREPAVHWDRLLALGDSGSTLVDDAVALGRGVGATWPAAPKAPMPEAGADWRAWLIWMGGEVRLEASHAAALRVYRERTGRDPLDDLHARWPDLATDSARLVVGAILRFADRLAAPTPSEVRADLLSEGAAAAAAARRELGRLLSEAATVPASEALPFLGPVLDSMLAGGRPPWPRARRLEYETALGQGFHGAVEAPVFVADAYLPPGLPEGRAVTAVDSVTWAGRDLRAPAVLVEFGPVRRVGDLVHLRWSWSAWFSRAPDETPEGYAGGESLWLARVDDGWVVVQIGQWIT